LIPRPLALLIDAGSYLYQAYFAIRSLIGRDGSQVNAVYGFTRTLLELLDEWRPESAAVAFDDPSTPTFRHTLYPDYKRTRPKTPERLTAQYPLAMEAARAMGIPALRVPGFEAEDVLATLTRRLRDSGVACVIVGRDKDLAQLVGPGVWLHPHPQTGIMDATAVRERYGVPPERIPELLALCGDRSDNIPGVPGIGQRTARCLLTGPGPLMRRWEESGALGSAGIRNAEAVAQALCLGQSSFQTGRTLALLRSDVPLDLPDEALAFHGIEPQSAQSFCDRFGFDRLRHLVALNARHADR
jgi:5'-3' exonuclease